MNEKTCRKCGHTTTYNSMEPQSCTACGAIYAKVEEALREAAEGRAARAASAAAAPAPRTVVVRGIDVHAYAARMRGDSLYPVWRQLVGIVTFLGYTLAVLLLVGGIVSVVQGSVNAGIVSVAGAVFIAVMTRATKEFWLMLADLSDANVRLAARGDAE